MTPNLEQISFCAVGNFGSEEYAGNRGDSALQHFLMMGGDNSSSEEAEALTNVGANIRRKPPVTDF